MKFLLLTMLNIYSTTFSSIEIAESYTYTNYFLFLSIFMQSSQILIQIYSFYKIDRNQMNWPGEKATLIKLYKYLLLVNTGLSYTIFLKLNIINQLEDGFIQLASLNIIYSTLHYNILAECDLQSIKVPEILTYSFVFIPILWIFFSLEISYDCAIKILALFGLYFSTILIFKYKTHKLNGVQNTEKSNNKVRIERSSSKGEQQKSDPKTIMGTQNEEKSIQNESPLKNQNCSIDIEFNNKDKIKQLNSNQKINDDSVSDLHSGDRDARDSKDNDQDLGKIHNLIHEIGNIGVIVYNNLGSLIYNNEKMVDIFECRASQILQRIHERLLKIQYREENSPTSLLVRTIKGGQLSANSVSNFKQKLQEEYRRQVSIETPNNSNESIGLIDNIHSHKALGDHQREKQHFARDNQSNSSRHSINSELRHNEENLQKLINILQEAIKTSINKKNLKAKNIEQGIGDQTFLSVMRRGHFQHCNNHGSNQGNNDNQGTDKFKQDLQLEIIINQLPYRMKIGVTKGLNSTEFLVFVFQKNIEQLEKRKKINLLSHQLRSPLNCSVGLLELLKNLKIEPEIRRKYVLPCLTSNYYLMNNLNMIIDLMEMENKEFQFEIQKVCLRSLFQNTIKMFKEQALMKGITINFSMDLEIDEIWSDSKRIKQVLINLLSNSIQFSHPNGKIDIKVSREFIEIVPLNQKANSILEDMQDSMKELQSEYKKGSVLEKVEQEKGDDHPPNIQRQVDEKVAEIKGQYEYRVMIEDYGIGINKAVLEEILNEDHDTIFRFEGEEDLRSQGFGIQSAARILVGLRDRSHTGFPLQIYSEVDQGCCYQFKLMDFVQKIDEESEERVKNFRKRSSWVDFNLKEKKMYLEQKSFSYESNQNIEISSLGHIAIQLNQLVFDSQISENIDDFDYEDGSECMKSNTHKSIDMRTQMNRKTVYKRNLERNIGNNNSGESNMLAQTENQIQIFNEILIVDDNQFNILTLECILEEFDLPVDKAFNGQQAIQAFTQRHQDTDVPYRLIFMDIDMPVKNGFQASREIIEYCKNHKINTVIVACTAFLGPEDMEKAQIIGIKEYISKPVGQEVMQDVINQYFTL